MSLRPHQARFAYLFSKLVIWATEQGYEVTFGDAYRDPRVFGKYGTKAGYGHFKSYHKIRLAHDINLFKDGKYIKTTEGHRPLGEKWESMDPLCSWGGRFNDGNHYSYGELRDLYNG